MENTLRYIMSDSGIAFGVAALIFLITLVFVAKQWIGFFTTLLFLLFSLAAGIGLSNKDSIKNYLKDHPLDHVCDSDIKMTQFQEKVLKNFDSLKTELEIQKHKIQELLDNIQALKKSRVVDSNEQTAK
jgi:hypothetical protein